MIAAGDAVVIGAGGGIGAALVRRLSGDARFGTVHALSRAGTDPGLPGVVAGTIDILDEDSIRAAATTVGNPVLVIVATGLLHEPGLSPERSWRDLDAVALARSYAVNTIGPALVAKHFLPLLPRTGMSAFAVLGARVGSIGDNRLGGWHGYRMAKAALAMLVRNLAIELGRRCPQAVCVALHPGTVATPLSAPFRRSLAEGQLTDPDVAAANLVAVLDGLGAADSGDAFAWDGARIVP